jgi:hypothetical protein
MGRLLNKKKQKKEPVPVFGDPYVEHSNLTFTGGFCGATETNEVTYYLGCDLVSSGACSTFVGNGTTSFTSISPQKTIEDYKKDIKSIPPKKLIHKFLNKYIGDEFRLEEKNDVFINDPFSHRFHLQELFKIVSNNNVEVLSFYLSYGQISFNVDKSLMETVSNYLQIPYDFSYSIVKQWFWEKNNFFSDSGLELSKFIP